MAPEKTRSRLRVLTTRELGRERFAFGTRGRFPQKRVATALTSSDRDRLRPAPHTHLAHDPLDVCPDGLRAQDEPVRDLRLGETVDEES